MWVAAITDFPGRSACIYGTLSIYLLGTVLNTSFNPPDNPVSRFHTIIPHFICGNGYGKVHQLPQSHRELGLKLGSFSVVCDSNHYSRTEARPPATVVS